MNNGKLRIVGCLAGLAGCLFTSSVFAQDAAPAAEAPASPPAPAAADASASTSGSAQVGMALPGAAPQAAAVAGNSDHDSVVGRLAIGYLGRNSILVETGLESTADPGDEAAISTPIIGIRYWLSDMLGIDAGIGFGMTSGSVDNGTTDTDTPSTKVFLLHGGVPLSLASAGHFSFQIVPELNVGFASRSETIMAGGMETEIDHGGFHLDVGARAGAEIHFGFIDVPQLSLQGGVGVRLNMDSGSTDGGVETSASRFSLATTVGDNPWNIFTSNVAALYYF
jgi:hypothetical protein